jgi:hypothetical protein
MAKYKEKWQNFDDATLIGYIDTENGMEIPIAADNVDYQAILAWIAGGNTPDPAYTQAEIDALTAEQTAYETTQTEAADEINLGVLAGKTYAQVDTYMDNNVTDLASAREVLKKLARIVLAIIKKLELET